MDERFKNPNYQDKKLSPKKSLYVNTGFSQLTAEEQSIAKEYEKLFDELNEGLPSYYQLENYALPTRQKTYMEQTTPLQDLSKWDRFKGILANPIMRFIREFVSNKDYDRDSEYAALEQYDLSSGEMAPRRLFKNRNMDIADQSLNLNRLLLEFAAHSSATKNLIDIIPQTAFFKEIDKKTEFLIELFPIMKRKDAETLASITTEKEIKKTSTWDIIADVLIVVYILLMFFNLILNFLGL
jgi:hypothetical protein